MPEAMMTSPLQGDASPASPPSTGIMLRRNKEPIPPIEELRACKKAVPSGVSSSAWKHFKVLQDGRFPELAFCNYCDMVIKRGSSSSPTNLQFHLKRHHEKIYLECLSEKSKSSPLAASPTDGVVEKGVPSSFGDKYVRWLVHDLQPLSVGESVDFMDMVRHGGPKVRVPDRGVVSERLSELEVQIRGLLQQQLKGESISITTEAWTSKTLIPFCSMHVSYINHDWELVTATLDCSPFIESQAAESVCAKLDEVLKEYGIPPENIVACVTDMAATMLSSRMLTSFDWHGCLGHLLELVTNKFFEGHGVGEFVQSARALVGYFEGSEKATHTLRMLAEDMEVKWRDLIPDTVNRWWSTYNMLSSVLHLEQPLRGMMASLPPSAKLSEEAWSIITLGVILLKPFMVAQKMLEGERYVTISWVPYLLNEISCALRKVMASMDPSLHDIGKIMYDDFTKRFGDGELSSLPRKVVMAAALDPRTKSLTYLEESQQGVIWDEITSVMMSRFDAAIAHAQPLPLLTMTPVPDSNLFEQKALPLIPKADAAAAASVEDEDDIFRVVNGRASTKQDFACEQDVSLSGVEKQHHLEQLQHEIKAFRSCPTLVHTSKEPANPLQWWANHQVLYPLLSNLARSLLAIPATSAASEMDFSVEGQLRMAKRSQSNALNLEQLVFLRGAWKSTEDQAAAKGMKRITASPLTGSSEGSKRRRSSVRE